MAYGIKASSCHPLNCEIALTSSWYVDIECYERLTNLAFVIAGRDWLMVNGYCRWRWLRHELVSGGGVDDFFFKCRRSSFCHFCHCCCCYFPWIDKYYTRLLKMMIASLSLYQRTRLFRKSHRIDLKIMLKLSPSLKNWHFISRNTFI